MKTSKQERDRLIRRYEERIKTTKAIDNDFTILAEECHTSELYLLVNETERYQAAYDHAFSAIKRVLDWGDECSAIEHTLEELAKEGDARSIALLSSDVCRAFRESRRERIPRFLREKQRIEKSLDGSLYSHAP
jgi:hypothetical protein